MLMTSYLSWIVLLVTVLSVSRTSVAQGPTDPTEGSGKQVRVLTIGNSFTRNATQYLDELSAAAGYELTHQSLSIGGSSLKLHAGKALAFEKDPSDEEAKYPQVASLQRALQSENWDFVTIQQVSRQSHNLATYRPYAQQLANIIHRYAPQAQILVHQTWAYRKDDPRFARSEGAANQTGAGALEAAEAGADEPRTQEAMYRGLSEAYRAITEELSAARIPVGDAFWMADQDPHYGYQVPPGFDVTQFRFPQVPDQTHSLHVGYRWIQRDGNQHLRMDGHHASLAGKYLAGCVWFKCLFGASPVGNSFVPDGLDSEYASALQRLAQQATQQGEDIALGVPHDRPPEFKDPKPRRYTFRLRASEIDSRTREYPEIDFVFGSEDDPADLEFAAVDTRVAPRGKLVIWLMGYNDGLFERLNEYGIHAIGVSYARAWFGKLCQPRPADAFARGRVRLEAATGLDFSDELHLQPPDGAAERARQLLMWLARENPQGDWEQFLADDHSRVRWDKVILSGASHGSTTAARFAKYQAVARVVMLCGPRDQDQDWQALPSATPSNRFFGFTHELDHGWVDDHYCRSWELLGLHRYGPIIDVDVVRPPYQNSRRLITRADVGGDARRAHSSVTPGRSSPENTDGTKLFDPVWHYLYTHPAEQVGIPTEKDPDCQRVHIKYE